MKRDNDGNVVCELSYLPFIAMVVIVVIIVIAAVVFGG